MADEKRIGFRFAEIQILSKALAFRQGSVIQEQINFEVKMETNVAAEINSVVILVQISLREGEKPAKLFEITVANFFEIDGFKDSIPFNSEKKAYEVPSVLENAIKSASLSTVRGIIFSELRGTYLNVIMPVIYVQDLRTVNDNPIFPKTQMADN